jgi:competence protein ComEA
VAHLSRTQLLLYGALAVAVLLAGARWIRAGHAQDGGSGAATFASGSSSSSGSSTTGSFKVSGEAGDVVVHVAGAVSRPGVYRLPSGARVTDAVERAGGALPAAAVDSVNLAARLADGQQVVVPAKAPGGSGPGGPATTGAEGATAGPISLGSATLEQLDSIDGIGPVTAQNIIDYRDQHGGLSSVEELDKVSGIGPATMQALRARLQP